MKIPLVDLKLQYSLIEAQIKEAIDDVFRQSVFISGKPLADFEKDFADYCRVKFAVGTSSGTSALYLALLANGIGAGDEVITVANTFIATAEAISATGARPVFIDIDRATYAMDISKINAALTKKTKAIIPVHLYGHPVDMDPLVAIARKNSLAVIEDAAQAHGAGYKGKKAGALADMGCFSFYPGKNLGAYGDAGAVVTDNPEAAERVRLLRDHGRKEKYIHTIEGFNHRLDTLQARLLGLKLKFLDGWNEKRRQVAAWYRDCLCGLPVKLPQQQDGCLHVYHLFVVETDARDELKGYLETKEISCGVHYPVPLHLQPAYSYLGYKEKDFPAAEEASRRILSLPIYPELEKGQVEYICAAIREYFTKKG
jgi:dTDP-4-amino-4,6-dideoxygalactose transaminase